MRRVLLRLLIVGSLLLAATGSPAAQEPDGTVKITRRSVAEGVGLSWGDGVLTYNGRDYLFTFQARGLLRNVDTEIAATELSGQVFNLSKAENFNGNYQKVEAATSDSTGGSRATIKNQNGVIVILVSTVEGRKFNLGPDGMDIEIKK